MCIWSNLVIGIIGSIVASIITLAVDRYLTRRKLERRVCAIAGVYRTVAVSPAIDTSNERVTITHMGWRRFRIESTGGPVGAWEGTFASSEDIPEYGIGIYKHPDAAWGIQEFQFDPSSAKINVYGTNKDRAGAIKPFSYVLEKESGANQTHDTTAPKDHAG